MLPPKPHFHGFIITILKLTAKKQKEEKELTIQQSLLAQQQQQGKLNNIHVNCHYEFIDIHSFQNLKKKGSN